MSWSIKQNGKNDNDNDAPRTFSHGALCPCMHAQSHVTCNPMDCILPGFSVHGILQARILEWVATPSSRGSSRPRDRTCISCDSCIGRWILYHWVSWEALCFAHVSSLNLQMARKQISTSRLLYSRGSLVLKHFRNAPVITGFLSPSTINILGWITL